MTDKKNPNVILERLSSPITGTFVLSWLAWNWKLVIIFFSTDLTSDLKIQKILTLSDWNTGFYWPLVSSIVYIFVMPFFLYALKSFTNFIDQINDIKQHEHLNRIAQLKQFHTFHSSHVVLISKAYNEEFNRLKTMHDSIAKDSSSIPAKNYLGTISSILHSIETTLETNTKIKRELETGRFLQYGGHINELLINIQACKKRIMNRTEN